MLWWFDSITRAPAPTQSFQPNMVAVTWSNYQGISPCNLAWQSKITICSTQVICEIILFHYWLWMEESTFPVFAAFIQMWHWWNRQQTNPGLGGWIPTCVGSEFSLCWCATSPYVDSQIQLLCLHQHSLMVGSTCIDTEIIINPTLIVKSNRFGS
jgi:hypothetical protein